MSRLFRHPGAWINAPVVLYTLAGFAAGVWMLTLPEIAVNIFGVLLTAHALVWSAYLLHDCAHHAVFAAPTANDRLGQLLSWVNGACLASYEGLKRKHLRHHADRLDVVTFDYRAVLGRAPPGVRRLVLALEWVYVPVVELMMRGLVIATPFQCGTRRERIRTVLLIAVRVALFAMLAVISIKALVLYAAAYFIFLHVLRFMDAFQHTYEIFVSRSTGPAPPDPRRSRRYEYENTYSNLISVRWPWLNLLVLNFPYHNAHHSQTGVPWYRLPALHRALYGDREPQVIPAGTLLANYHRYRVARVLAGDYGVVHTEGARATDFIGAVGVSFLTAI